MKCNVIAKWDFKTRKGFDVNQQSVTNLKTTIYNREWSKQIHTGAG